MLSEWQSVLIRFVAAIAVVGTVILTIAFVSLLVSGNQDVVQQAAIFVILGATGTLMIVSTFVIIEKDALSDRLPKCTWRSVGIALLAGLVVVPVTHFFFLLHVGFVSLCAVTVLKSDAAKTHGVAVCNMCVGVVLVSVWQSSGAWDDGDLLRSVLALYAAGMMLLPGFLSIASVFRLHHVAQYCMWGFAVQAFHSLAILLSGVTMMLNDAFDRDLEPFNEDVCFKSNAYSVVTGTLALLSLISESDDYDGDTLDYPCYDANPAAGVAVTRVVIDSGGQAEVTLLAITAAYVVVLAAVCYTFPFHLRQVHAEEEEDDEITAGQRVRAAVCRCFAAIMKSIARLICVGAFVVAAIVLFSLFVVVAENSESSVEPTRRLQMQQAIFRDVPEPVSNINDTDDNSSSDEEGECLEVCWSGADLPSCPWLQLSFSATPMPGGLSENASETFAQPATTAAPASWNSTENASDDADNFFEGDSEEESVLAFEMEQFWCRADPVCQLCHICSAALPTCAYNDVLEDGSGGEQICGPCFKAEEMILPTLPPRDYATAAMAGAAAGGSGLFGVLLLLAVWKAPCWQPLPQDDDDIGDTESVMSGSSRGSGRKSTAKPRQSDTSDDSSDGPLYDENAPEEASECCRLCRIFSMGLGALLSFSCLVLLVYVIAVVAPPDPELVTGLPSEAACEISCSPFPTTLPPTTTTSAMAVELVANVTDDEALDSELDRLFDDDDLNSSNVSDFSNASEFEDGFGEGLNDSAATTLPSRTTLPTTTTMPTTTTTTTTTALTDRCMVNARCRQCKECGNVLPTCVEAPALPISSTERRQPRGGYFEWAWMPALYLAETWCDFGPWAPIGICGLTFAFQAYTCSVVASAANKRKAAVVGKTKAGIQQQRGPERKSEAIRQERMQQRGFAVTDVLQPEPKPSIIDIDDDGCRVFKI